MLFKSSIYMRMLSRKLIGLFLSISVGIAIAAEEKKEYREDSGYYSNKGNDAVIAARESNNPKFYREAEKFWKISAEMGLIIDQYNLAVLYCNGLLGQVDFESCNYYLKLAANQEDPASAYQLGMNYLEGNGFQKNLVEGINWITKAAEGGLAEAALYLGMIYRYGSDGIYPNAKKAFKYLEIAAKKNNKVAQYELGKLFESNPFSSFSDVGKELQWYLASANQDYPEAQYELGRHYYGADTRPIAFEWFKKAADNGHIKAMVETGSLHLLSYAIHKDTRPGKPALESINEVKGIKPDIYLAEQLFIQAVDSGSSEGLEKLGNLYLYWEEVFPEKHGQAYRFLEKAAKLDSNLRASITLGHLYSRQIPEKGGAPYDKDKSLFWYGKALQAGYKVNRYVKKLKGSSSDFDWYAFGALIGTALVVDQLTNSDGNGDVNSSQTLTEEQAAYSKCWKQNEKRITYCTTAIAYCDNSSCRYDATCSDSWNGCESALELSNRSGAYYCDTENKWNYHENIETVMSGICSP